MLLDCYLLVTCGPPDPMQNAHSVHIAAFMQWNSESLYSRKLGAIAFCLRDEIHSPGPHKPTGVQKSVAAYLSLRPSTQSLSRPQKSSRR